MAAEVKAEDQVLANAAAELTARDIDERQRLMLQRNEGFRYSDESREVFNLRVRLGQPPTEGEITTAATFGVSAFDVDVSVLWLQFLTPSTSELGDGGASFDHEHQHQCNTVPLALQGVK